MLHVPLELDAAARPRRSGRRHPRHADRFVGEHQAEDAGIPAHVIDDLMGHEGGRPGEGRGSRIGTRYRHTTTEMLQRVREVINARLQIVLKVAEREEPAAAERRAKRQANRDRRSADDATG